ncbi:hypothetical protein PsorP6_014384 [Peronosclerospora sorghi]|uniref:Uncharacterized protein n=1 Tax=Peronosclerospora sorghi TaxID=230839 RepID=A0ACC0VHM9_9STRA|nr:hypothetical protein PsorP6_014384 [Peronosclerospora sorghi]
MRTSPALPRPRASNGAPLTITHEIRQLRSRVAEIEAELRDLNRKWAAQLLNQLTLAIAQRSAKEKHGVYQTKMAHGELPHMLLEQQLLFASLQAAVLRAPLYSNGQDMFEALHFSTHLGHDDDEREKQLLAHKERLVATLPSIVMAAQDKNRTKPVLLLSQIDITGCKDCTLISSIFISEIPHTSLEDVDAAAMAYFDDIPTSMKRHFMSTLIVCD